MIQTIEQIIEALAPIYQVVACIGFPLAVLLAISHARGERDYLFRASEFLTKYEDERAVSRLHARRVQLLKQLMLLTHRSVSHFTVGPAQVAQWNAYVKEFPGDADAGDGSEC